MNNNFYKKAKKKKLEIKAIRTKLENIIQSIWIERWNWKAINFYKRTKKKNLKSKDWGPN